MYNKGENTKLCELCFVSCDEDFVVVDDDKRKMLETVQLELNFFGGKEPIICKSCTENLERCFEFKICRLYIEDCITSFSSDKDNDTVDVLDIYLNRNENKDKRKMPQDHTLCRLCLELIKYGSHISLNSDTKDRVSLSQFFPELDLNIIRDPVICELCYISIQDYFDFMINCLNVDITVKKLHTNKADKEDKESKLHLQTELMLKNTLSYTNECDSEIDSIFNEQDILNTFKSKAECLLGVEDEEFFLKTEPLGYEMETTNSESLRSSQPESTVQTTDNTNHFKLRKYKKGRIHNFERHKGVGQKVYQELETKPLQEPPMYQCRSCPFKTEYKASLQKHIQSQHDSSNAKKYRCGFCSFKTIHKFNLNRHILVQHSGTMYSCKICPFKTKYAYSLIRRHKLVHQNESEVTMYSCKYCQHKTKHKKNLKVHLQTHKTVKASLYQCQVCPFKTKYMKSMRRHLASAHNGVSYQQGYLLVRPECQNSPGLGFLCDLCEYKTTCKDSYTSHLLSHRDPSDATVYRCGECHLTTKYKGNLKRHKLVHQIARNVKKHQCGVCHFETSRRDSLVVHMRMHKTSLR